MYEPALASRPGDIPVNIVVLEQLHDLIVTQCATL